MQAWLVVQVMKFGAGQSFLGTRPPTLVAAFHRRSQFVAGVDVYIVPAAVAITFQEDGCLVDSGYTS
jgi:hypothetical protein